MTEIGRMERPRNLPSCAHPLIRKQCTQIQFYGCAKTLGCDLMQDYHIPQAVEMSNYRALTFLQRMTELSLLIS